MLLRRTYGSNLEKADDGNDEGEENESAASHGDDFVFLAVVCCYEWRTC